MYDQTLQGGDVAPADFAHAAVITLNGIGALPVATFSTSGLSNLNGPSPTVAQPYTKSVVVNVSGSVGGQLLSVTGDTAYLNDQFFGAAHHIALGDAAGPVSVIVSAGTWMTIQGVVVSGGGVNNGTLNINGSSTSGNMSTTTISGTTAIGGNGGVDALMTEWGYWSQEQRKRRYNHAIPTNPMHR